MDATHPFRLSDIANGDGTEYFQLNGIGTSHNLGFQGAIGLAGDFNGDGFDDVVLGARGANPNGNDNAGQTYVLFGKADGFDAVFELSDLDASSGFVINGIDAEDISGDKVGPGGDINADGYGDIVIGGYRADSCGSNCGESYVVFGSASPPPILELSDLDGVNGFAIHGIDEDDGTGWSVGTVGDFNGDGYDDVFVGAQNTAPTDEAYVIFGKLDAFEAVFHLADLDGNNGFIISGPDQLPTVLRGGGQFCRRL